CPAGRSHAVLPFFILSRVLATLLDFGRVSSNIILSYICERLGVFSVVCVMERGGVIMGSNCHVFPPPQYKGRANLHTFEDWCGSSTAQLRMNLHYPLYPHSRTTVKKLAVSPRWMNYGLRIFGYLHPYTDGEFVFAVSSDDNSEFWLSRDNSPLNLQLLAWIGKTGMEWTAPGEFGKYASQTSRPVWLSVQRRYFFEIVHKQNDRGTDHIEVAWQLNQEGLRFTVISSKYISLYSNESALRMSDITHVPQTAASHTRSPSNQPDNQLSNQPAADMLRVDPRDTLYQIPALDSRFLQGVLPDCSYKPSYIIKGFPLLRYQGLQFVHMSYIYPNDYTRLTHMETDNTCFYHDSPLYLDRLDGEAPPNVGGASKKDPAPPDYGDDNDDYAQRRRRKLFSLPQADRAPTHTNMSDTLTYKKRRETNAAAVVEQRAVVQTRATEQDGLGIPPGPGSHTSLQTIPAEQLRVAERPADRPKPGGMPADNEDMGPVARKQTRPRGRPSRPQPDYDNTLHGDLPPGVVSGMDRLVEGVDRGGGGERGGEEVGVSESLWGLEGDSEEVEGLSYDSTPRPVFDPEVNWAQTFQVTPLDLQAMRSDWIDLRCNVSGNLLLRPRDALPVIKAFMDKLNHRHHGRFSLVRVLNVERRVDGAQGSRYFLELELRDVNGQHLRLSHYIYTLIRHRRSRPRGVPPLRPAPEMLLCNPVGFHWNPTATVHFIVPVKNQARWVQQLIVDMEGLYQTTGDPNFNLIITDYNSTDMDIEAALKASTLHRYQYLKLSGNFERSAGLQAGIDLITHSIVFLCDLHIHFPPSIIDSVRKHCVEGHMAFAPIVMRLDCGATPREPRGYWEVNGFGLLGIYKSDLDAAGGMNTHDFTDRWGGEDWELLDRILQSGLEVERIYMRNFLHHYHSKRGMWNRRTQRSGT
uniref:Beta-1,4-N-acetylgalactosaminyltransferase n=1 Tax=Oncorhynchus tshawytscha TaxID=74940 RepID=A0A8C8M9K5_ONCTS